MAMSINTNVASLNAQRNASRTQNELATTMSRLSSGMRINSAKDDAAGLAISERFTSQIRGTNQAARNANDGISLAQTAEAAMSSISNNLQRVREMAVQSANATNSASDRAALQKEVKELTSEIQRVASQTDFNGQKLLNGNFNSAISKFQVGANSGQVIELGGISDMRASVLGKYNGVQLDNQVVTGSSAASATQVTLAKSDGSTQVISLGNVKGDAKDLATALNAAGIDGLRVTADPAEVTGTRSGMAGGADEKISLTLNGQTISFQTGAGSQSTAQNNLLEAINQSSASTGVRAELTDTNGIKLSTADGRNIEFSGFSSSAGASATWNVDNLGLRGVPAGGSLTGGVAGSAAGVETLTLSVNGTNVTFNTTANNAAATRTGMMQAINAQTQTTGVTASEDDSGNLVLTASNTTTTDVAIGIITGGTDWNAANLGLTGVAGSTIRAQSGSSVTGGKLDINFKAATGSDVTSITFGHSSLAGLTSAQNVESTGTSLDNIDISTVEGANKAMVAVDAALEAVTSERAKLGAIQNRFSSTIENLQSTSENMSAARSRIQDADFASETAALSRAQVLQQAGTAMIAQANQAPQQVMSLLR